MPPRPALPARTAPPAVVRSSAPTRRVTVVTTPARRVAVVTMPPRVAPRTTVQLPRALPTRAVRAPTALRPPPIAFGGTRAVSARAAIPGLPVARPVVPKLPSVLASATKPAPSTGKKLAYLLKKRPLTASPGKKLADLLKKKPLTASDEAVIQTEPDLPRHAPASSASGGGGGGGDEIEPEPAIETAPVIQTEPGTPTGLSIPKLPPLAWAAIAAGAYFLFFRRKR